MARSKKTFEEYIELCKIYKEENGDLKIPYTYVTKDGLYLGRWLSYQRRHEDRCSEEHKKMLNDLGFIWFSSHSWMFLYQKAVAYYKEYGDINNLSNNVEYQGSKLGLWLNKNRQRYSNGTLSDKRIELLLKLKFDFDIAEKNHKKLELLTEYFNEKGHLLPAVGEIYKEKPVGRYVSLLRQYYKNGKLSDDEILNFEKIGMCWNGRKGYWYHCYNLCIEYIEKIGHLTAQTEYKGFNLGAWESRQTALMAYGSLDDEQIKLLKKMQILNVNTGKVRSNVWLKNYFIAEEYFNENKNLCPEEDVLYKGLNLKKWLDSQREKYNNGQLSKKNIKMLDDIGMKWNLDN